jgi:hypothetical protein
MGLNSLSWFLYLADVVSNFSFVFGAGAAALFALSALFIMFYYLDDSVGRGYGPNKTGFFYPKLFAVMGLVFAIAAAFIPSKSTMYMIAGSQIGETVITSQEGKEILSKMKDRILYELETDEQKIGKIIKND